MPVYIARFGALGPVKIGHSISVQRRLDGIQSRLWDEIHLLRLLDGAEADERKLHARFSHLKIRNEWFHYSDDMMGDLGLLDLQSDPTQTLTKCQFDGDGPHTRRSAALRDWMVREGYFEHGLSRVLGVSPSTIVDWLKYGHFPANGVAERLVELSGGELQGTHGMMPLRNRSKPKQHEIAA